MDEILSLSPAPTSIVQPFQPAPTIQTTPREEMQEERSGWVLDIQVPITWVRRY